MSKKLTGFKCGFVYTEYIGRYVTRIWTNTDKVVYQNDGTELDWEGIKLLLKLKHEGYDICEQ